MKFNCEICERCEETYCHYCEHSMRECDFDCDSCSYNEYDLELSVKNS